ncbi:MAG: trypsin-like serine peptidase [Lachnospiraceae bacterium]
MRRFRLGGDGTAFDKSGIKNLNLGLIGYPGEVNNKKVHDEMYRHACKEHWFSNDGLLLKYKIDSSNGQSGGPIYRTKNGKRYIIAVHARGGSKGNSGRYLDSSVKKFIKKYM